MITMSFPSENTVTFLYDNFLIFKIMLRGNFFVKTQDEAFSCSIRADTKFLLLNFLQRKYLGPYELD